MRMLVPAGPDATDAEIASWYEFDPGVRLRSNMVMSLDGRATGHDGLAGALSGPADTRLLGLLRGVADAVVVAAGTIRAEGYNPIRARESLRGYRASAGLAEHPALVVVTRRPTLDPGLDLFTQAPVRPIVLCADDDGSLVEVADVIECPDGSGGVDLAAAVAQLAERGLRRLHTEGGPHLLGGFVAAGVLDEYCLTLSPMLAGGASELRPVMGGSVPTGFTLAQACEDGAFLFLRYRRTSS